MCGPGSKPSMAASPVFDGPVVAPIFPGMLRVLLYEYDNLLEDQCPACVDPFEAGQYVFQSANLAVSLHETCVVELARPLLETEQDFENCRRDLQARLSTL